MRLLLAGTSLAALGALLYYRQNTPQAAAPGTPSPVTLPEKIGAVMDKITGTPARGIRNNNPLNIEYNAANQWNGQTGTDGRFATFDTPHNGIRAGARLMRNYDRKYGLNTVRGIVSRWAPPNENDTTAYVSSVAKRSGLFPDMLLEPNDYPALIAAMIYHENGQQPYDMALITAATLDGLS